MKSPQLSQRILRSLQLDRDWIITPNIPEKWKFLYTKYLFLLFPKLFWNKKIRAFGIPGWGRTTYITHPDRIAHLQSIFIDHAYLQNTIAPHGIIIDVGAHVGEFALLAHTCLQPKHVYSFEPVPRSFELLEHNNNDTHFNSAVSSQKEIKLYIDEQSGMSSQFKTPTTIGEVASPSVSLDDVSEIQALPTIELLKIDVEGMEYEVLQSSPTTVKKSKYLVIEVALSRESSASGIKTLLLLRDIVPTIQLLHIGHIIRYADTGKEAAVDMLFGSPTIRRV